MQNRTHNGTGCRAATVAATCAFFATVMVVANAQHDGEIRVDIAPCIDVESVLERLDCYDALARDALSAGQSAAGPERAANPDTAAAAEPEEAAGTDASAAADVTDASDAAAAEDSFGFAAQRERRAERNRDEIAELTSEVSALREIVPGQLEITLTNGQVWRQTNSDRYNLQIGYPVRIYPTRFGQYYRLTSEILRGFVQVERIR